MCAPDRADTGVGPYQFVKQMIHPHAAGHQVVQEGLKKVVERHAALLLGGELGVYGGEMRANGALFDLWG